MTDSTLIINIDSFKYKFFIHILKRILDALKSKSDESRSLTLLRQLRYLEAIHDGNSSVTSDGLDDILFEYYNAYSSASASSSIKQHISNNQDTHNMNTSSSSRNNDDSNNSSLSNSPRAGNTTSTMNYNYINAGSFI